MSQTEDLLLVTIYAPFTHIDKTEVFMDDCDFRFFSKPYYLRLHLPAPVTESEAAAASWDSDTTSFIVKCPKLNPGQRFEGLDMLTELLKPKGESDVRNKIEICSNNGDSLCDDEEDLEEPDWYYEQKLPDEEDGLHGDGESGYGFAFQFKGVYSKLLSEFGEILDLANPDSLSQEERDSARKQKEEMEFSSDHYLCDLYESEVEIEECLAEPSPFSACVDWEGPEPHPSLAFSRSEQEQLLALPAKQLLVPPSLTAATYLGLADLLYGWLYSRRVLGPDCVEAAWCAAKLSASLSCLACFPSPRAAVVSGLRRSLCYPLYRHWELGRAVWRDVVTVLRAGRAAVLKCVLALQAAGLNTPGHHIFSQLYLTDYAVWLQSRPHSHLLSLAAALQQALDRLTKQDLGLELEELEEAARLTLLESEQESVEELTSRVTSLAVSTVVDSDDDSDDESSSGDDNDSSD